MYDCSEAVSLMCSGCLCQILGPYSQNDLTIGKRYTVWVIGSTKCGEQEAGDRRRLCLLRTYLEHCRDTS